ncbi:hypothetical protein HID58_075036, partial [Brassica napus]
LRSIDLAILGSTQAGTHSERRLERVREMIQSHLLDACKSILGMTNGLDLALGSSSIGTRVHSRRRVGNEACESMASPESSFDLSAKIEELWNAAVGEAPPPLGGDRFSRTGERSISRSDYSSGRDTTEQLLELPLERREVSFLVSDEALDRCSIRGVMSGFKGVEALVEYMKALEAMSARKAAVKQIAPVEDEEVQFVGSSRRQVNAAVVPSSSKKKSKASGSVPKTTSPASFDWSAVLSNLNAKAFPLVPVRLSLDGDSFAAIRSLQGDLLQVACHVLCLVFATSLFIGWIILMQAASQIFHLGERMEDKTIAKAEVDALIAQLREGKDAVLAKEKEIKVLKLKVGNQGEAMERVATENASLQKPLEDKEEDICELRYATEVFDAEKAMAVSGAKVVARWELMRELLHHQTDSWEPAAALEKYKIVKTTEAELLRLPAPCFDDEPQVPERDGASEPADGPLTN